MRRLLLQSWLWKPKVEDEVSDEVAFHLEMRRREYVARGMTPDEARRAALARFGDLERAQARCREIGKLRDRTMRRHQYLSELRQDLSFAVRQLFKNRGFAIVATLTLALGIGATASIFSVVHAVVLRPLAVADPQRLLQVYELWRGNPSSLSVGNFETFRAQAPAFESMAARTWDSFTFNTADGAERVVGALVTGDFFKVLGVAALHGRVFTTDEDTPGREQVVVLSEQLWRRRFGADAAIVNHDIRLNGRPYTVLGVMPASFQLTTDSEELWIPIAFTADQKAQFDGHYLDVIGRLKSGVSPSTATEQARAQLVTIMDQLRKAYPEADAQRSATVADFTSEFVGDYRERLFVLLGAVGLVLLIACGNVANLLLARGAVRMQELAVRSAIGAGRGRIMRQLLTESLLLAMLGATGGLALAMLAINAFIRLSPPGVPRLEQARLDPLTIAVAIGIAVISSLLFGLAPAMRAARADAHDTLKGSRGSVGVARDRLRQALIVAEVALALVLLIGSGLLIRTAMALQQVDLGFDTSGVLSARVFLPRTLYLDPQHVTLTFERMVDEVGRVPGVATAAVVSQVPFSSRGNSNGLVPEGRPLKAESAIDSVLRLITPGYLQTMRIPLKRGRAFTDADRAGGQHVMIISETLARQAWPGQDPIGKRITCCEAGPDGKSPDWKVVIGVAGDVHIGSPADPPVPEFYLPVQQAPRNAWDWIRRTMFIVARTSGSQAPDAMTAPVRQAIARIDPTLPLFDIQTMDERLDGAIATRRFNMALLTTLGAVGMLLAAIGIYGVIAYFVSQRTQEIGVRLALGASPRDVLTLVVRQALRPVLVGVAVGVGLALFAARLLESQLFGVAPRDPLTLVGVTLTLIAVAVAASLVPARRAARVDPTRALHQ